MIVIPPKLEDIVKMREIVRPQVELGVILDRSVEVMANMIRSYRIAWEEESVLLDLKRGGSKVSLESRPLESFQNPIMLGFCALHIHSLTLAEIRSLIVIEEARNLGVASCLISNCEQEGQILGIKEILVLTYQRFLFEKLGFTEISKDKIPNQKIWADCILCKHFPQCDEIALIKVL